VGPAGYWKSTLKSRLQEGVVFTGSISPSEINAYFNAVDVGLLAQAATPEPITLEENGMAKRLARRGQRGTVGRGHCEGGGHDWQIIADHMATKILGAPAMVQS
jgi:hypothetical protein